MSIKKIFTALTALAAALLACIAVSVSAGAATSGDYRYDVLADGTVKITGYNGYDTKLVIPSVIDGKNVTSIGDRAFQNKSSITSVTIPEGVISIGNEAFARCSQLSEVKLPISAETIGNYTFAYCGNLTEINIPRCVTYIGEGAFFSGNIKKVWLTSSLEYIGCYAFYQSEIDYVYFAGTYSEYMDISIDHLSNTELDNPKNFNYLTFTVWRTEPTVRATNALRLVWGVNPNADGYIIEQEIDGKWVRIKKITDPSVGEYRVSGLKVDTAYNFRIFSYATIDNVLRYSGNLYISERTAMPTLTGLKVKARSDSAVRLAWDKYADADGYIIENKVGDRWYTTADITDGSATEYRIGDLWWSVEYTFGITAYKKNADGLSTTVRKTITVNTNPLAVTELKLDERTSSSLSFSWWNRKDRKPDGYIIEMKDGNTWTRVGKVVSSNSFTSFKKTGLKAGTAYTFRIKAYKMYGKTALYGAAKTISARTYPSAVSGLKLKAANTTAVRLAWNKNTSADGYIIEMKSGNSWTRVGKITKNTTVEFRKSGLKIGTVYSFRIKAYKMSGKTALYSGYTTISARTNPSAVSGLKLKGRAADALRIAWAKNTSADGYIIEMKSGGKWVRVGKITKNSTVEFKKSKLKAGTLYTFRVKAYKMSGKTALYSGYKTITVKTK